ncbi:CRS2-associated factor 1 [Nymphaea thermarum]|nr:CRS2-associated factor 1 [Nymphaea thermarum]
MLFFPRLARSHSATRTTTTILLLHRLLSSSTPLPPLSPTSRLRDYGFHPPPRLSFVEDPKQPDSPHYQQRRPPRPLDSDDSAAARKKKEKPPYRPPSSLDRTGLRPAHSELPFDFRFSYTESNSAVRPIGLREPKYSPFGPGRLDREWTGVCASAFDCTVGSVDGEDAAAAAAEAEKAMEKFRMHRKRMLGEPLSPAERKVLVEKHLRHSNKKQVNLGRDGLTHNMLNDIHNHWKHSEAVRIKCMGVPTVDMENVYTQLEDKTGGLIIHKQGGVLILYRGRYYNPKKRPAIPLMLWKPHEPVYPRLIKTTIDGLTIEETKEMRKAGLKVPPLTKLAKNGVYARLVPMVRDAFLTDELVRIDCRGLNKSDYRRIGCKLRVRFGAVCSGDV